MQELIAEVHHPALLDRLRRSLVVGLGLRRLAERRLGGAEPGVRVAELGIVALLLDEEVLLGVLAVELLGEVDRVLEHALGQRHGGPTFLVQRRAHLHDPLRRLAHPPPDPIFLGVAEALEKPLPIHRLGGQRRDHVDQRLHG